LLLNEYQKELRQHIVEKTIQDIVLKLYRDFEELCFSICKADGNITVEQLQDKSIYDFYRYKQLLQQHISRNKKGK